MEPGDQTSTTLWSAQIVVDRTQIAEIQPNLMLQQTLWASSKEAAAFLRRRMPQAKIPKRAGLGSRVIGQISPARIAVIFVAGLDLKPGMVQHLFVDLGTRDVYELDEDGGVYLRPAPAPQEIKTAA